MIFLCEVQPIEPQSTQAGLAAGLKGTGQKLTGLGPLEPQYFHL